MTSNKMERFTQRARRVLALGQDEAERFNDALIYPFHVLIGLRREEGGVAGRVLRDLGLPGGRAFAFAVYDLSRQAGLPGLAEERPELELTGGTKRFLELAVDEARRMGHHYIGTEHLLLGMVRLENDEIIPQVLQRYGLSAQDVRQQTRRVLQESPVQLTSPPAPPPSSGTR